MINSAVSYDYWKPISLVQGGTPLSHCFFADDLVLFSEAYAGQARVVADILDRFCEASGQSVSRQKSRIYFSKNTPPRVATEVSEVLGIAATTDLGRYLGVPILHGKVFKHTYDFLLDRLDSRLAGWKAENLSLAGRVTLASSVLNSLPCYVMQTAFLPVSLCDKIDQKVRNFIWGSSNGVRKLHNVNWETVCKPKSLGGLGLRSARELNQAFLMKVVWGLITKPDELWARTLISKYLVRNELGFSLKRKTGYSSLWRGVLKVWNYTLRGIQWSIKDGRKARFWSDCWLDSGIILRDFALNTQGVDLSLPVSHFVLPDGNWNLDVISSCLPNECVVQIIGMTPPCDRLGEDIIAWGLEANGCFSVKSAYLLLKDIEPNAYESPWRKVWSWEGPAKIRQFLWLVTHGKIMTNEERRRRHIAADAICPECQGICEDVDHVIRSCGWAQSVWRTLLLEVLDGEGAMSNFTDWWIRGIQFSELSSRAWQVSIHHIYREANCAADHLANFGHSLDLGCHFFNYPDVSLQYWLRFDLVGSCTSRLIRNTM
ncbi:Putative ribonuclease H protein At1g65750 [Linum perenne]